MKATVSDAVRRLPTIDAQSRILASRISRIVSSIQPFQFTILPAENGYRLRVNHGAAEYLWPNTYPTLEKAGEQILKALTTASECRGETGAYEVDCGGPLDVTLSPRTNMTTELKVGDPAPDFKATAVGGIYGGGHEVKFSELAGSTLVLYFYPENDTPGCTIQACDLRDSWRELQSKVELFGVSVDSVESHQEFIKKHGLPFPLLSDPDREILKAYQVWSEEHMVTERTTYLIGSDRKIKATLKNVKPSEHVTQLLKALAS